jgi:hypothetical protein
MLISLDYDDTYTRDPVFWLGFVRNAKQAGHTVYCVTMRNASERVETVLANLVEEVIYTSRGAKREATVSRGIWIDVWIDDMPHFVNQHARGELVVPP